MSRFFHFTTFILDIIFVIAIWYVDLNPSFILSLIALEIFFGFGFFGGVAIMKTTFARMKNSVIVLVVISAFSLWLLELFHSFFPPYFTYTTHFKMMILTNDFWYITSYVGLTVFTVCKILIKAFVEDKDETRAKVLLSRVIFMFYRILVFSLAFAFLMPFFAHEESQKILEENVDNYIKTAVTVIIICFGLLDIGAERKIMRLKRG